MIVYDLFGGCSMIVYDLHIYIYKCIYIYIFNDVPPCFGGFPVMFHDFVLQFSGHWGAAIFHDVLRLFE